MGSGLRPGSLAATNQQDGRPPPTVSLPDLLQTQLQTMVGGLFGCLLLLVGTCSAWHDSYHDLAPEWPDYLDSFKAELRHPREEPGLQFPPLSARQKQFALNPGHPEYYRERPDFLQFGLQALDDTSDPRQEAARESEKEALMLEKQLEAVLDGLNQGDGVGDTKRAMVGEPRALPYITGGGQIDQSDDTIFATIIAATTAGAVFAVLGVGYCYHRASQVSKEGEESEYPAYGVTGPAKEASPAGDRKLAQSAQMYHYQHQKNQMIGLGNGTNGGGGNASAGEESEPEGEEGEGDYTVYECPGLASTDEMEVKNPLFNDDPTPKNP